MHYFIVNEFGYINFKSWNISYLCSYWFPSAYPSFDRSSGSLTSTNTHTHAHILTYVQCRYENETNATSRAKRATTTTPHKKTSTGKSLISNEQPKLTCHAYVILEQSLAHILNLYGRRIIIRSVFPLKFCVDFPDFNIVHT